MKSARIGDAAVGRIGLGLMGMSAVYTGGGSDDEASVATINRAIDLGVTFLDTAETYGPYTNESLLGRVLKDRRDEVVIASKFGLLNNLDGGRRGINGSPENLRIAVEGSLTRLGVDTIDLYYQHRMDPAVPIEDTVGGFAELVREGKIRGYGLSEAGAATIRRAHAVHPVTAVQSEYSLWTRDPEAEVLPVLRELGIAFVPYSPLGRGFLTGAIKNTDAFDAKDWRRTNPRFEGENLEANLAIVADVEAVAAELDATPAQVALAWLLAQGEDIVPIPGTKRIERLEENVGADALELSAEQLERLGNLAAPVGERYSDMTPLGR